jgi:hypothetical protein
MWNPSQARANGARAGECPSAQAMVAWNICFFPRDGEERKVRAGHSTHLFLLLLLWALLFLCSMICPKRMAPWSARSHAHRQEMGTTQSNLSLPQREPLVGRVLQGSLGMARPSEQQGKRPTCLLVCAPWMYTFESLHAWMHVGHAEKALHMYMFELWMMDELRFYWHPPRPD